VRELIAHSIEMVLLNTMTLTKCGTQCMPDFVAQVLGARWFPGTKTTTGPLLLCGQPRPTSVGDDASQQRNAAQGEH
jgi:hypothetical protein